MLTRRQFVSGGLAALLLGFGTACSTPPDNPKPIPEKKEDDQLKDIIEHGLQYLRERDYATARKYFETRRYQVPSDHPDYTTNAHLSFLYAMSHIPDGSVWDGKYQTAGEELTTIFHRIKNNPSLLESLQEFLAPFFQLDDCARYKKVFKERLGRRYQIFCFLLDMIEEDYADAERALKEAFPYLKRAPGNDEQAAVRDTLANLVKLSESSLKRLVLEELRIMARPDKLAENTSLLEQNRAAQQVYGRRIRAYGALWKVAQ